MHLLIRSSSAQMIGHDTLMSEKELCARPRALFFCFAARTNQGGAIAREFRRNDCTVPVLAL